LQNSPDQREEYKITQENNELIEKMINRKRQSSVTAESQAKPQSKLIILNKKSRRNVMKRVLDKNNKRSFLNETHISANKSQISSQKSPNFPKRNLRRKLQSTKVIPGLCMKNKKQGQSRNSSKEIMMLNLINPDHSRASSTLKQVSQEVKQSQEDVSTK